MIQELVTTPTFNKAVLTQIANKPVEGVATTESVKESKPPNPVLPTINEIFWSAIFFILFWMLMKYVLLPPIRAAQKRRSQEIESSKDKLDSFAQEKAKLNSDYEAALTNARQEAAQMLDAVRLEAEQYRSGVITAAQTEVDARQQQQDEELEVARQAALVSLEGDMQVLTSQAVEAILGKSPDKKVVSEHMAKLNK